MEMAPGGRCVMPLDRFQVEGTREDVLARLREMLADGHYSVRVSRLIESPAPNPGADAHFQSLRSRTPEEIEAARKRTTVYTPPLIKLPPGKTLEDVIRDVGPEGAAMSPDEVRRYLAELS
jgi:hypothetical protein